MKHLIICTTVFGLTAAFPGNPSVASSHPTAPACRQPPGVAVPNANTARKIATAVISARQAPEQLNRYRLVIEPDGEMTGYWRAWQMPINSSGTGGGGISLRIDRCTAAVSGFHYQR